jgi:thiamine-phosphate pyrophosphorylase
MHDDAMPRGLYLLTPDEADTARLLARVAPLLPFTTWLQYRNKPAGAELRAEQAAALQDACVRAGVPLVVNDDATLALRVGAAGAHLGEGDGAIVAARTLLGPRAIVGASCYDDPARAQAAAAAGASYLAFGALFPSGTKPRARRATPAHLRAARVHGLPLVAIGGITPDNAAIARDAGADLVAVIGGVFDAPDPLAAARAIHALFHPTRS